MAQDHRSVTADTYGPEWVQFSNAAKEYERFLQEGELRPRQVRALDLADLQPGQWVLDLGCGRGEVSLYCARQGARVLALDFSSDCLALASQAMGPESGSLRGLVAPVRGESKTLPLRSDSVWRVLMLDVVEHLYPWELELALAEAHRVLQPGGYLVVHTLPNRWALGPGYGWARFLFRRLPPNPRSEWEKTVHINEQDILGLYRALRGAGFRARVWLEDSILAQAQWQQGGKAFPTSDLRAKAYPLLVNPLVRALYRLALVTPLRLILANDIYAVGFKGPIPAGKKWGRRLEGLLGLWPKTQGQGER